MTRQFLEENDLLQGWIKWPLGFVLPSGRVHNSEPMQRIERLSPMIQQIPPLDPGSVSAKPDVRGRFDLADPIAEG